MSPVHRIRADDPPLALDLGELWAGRDLLRLLAWRQLAVRYKQTWLGAGWAIVQPLATSGIFTLFLGKLATLPSAGHPYFAFSAAGMLPWICFQAATTAASGSLVENLALVTKVYVPRLLIPLAAASVAFVDMLVALAFLALLFAGLGVLRPAGLLLLVPSILALGLAAGAVGIFLAAANTRFRDVRVMVPFLLQCWLFASPVFYPFELVPAPWRPLAALNPMAGVVEGFRAALLGGPAPLGLLATSALTSTVLLALALRTFARMERYFADTI